MENLRLEVVVYPGCSPYENRITELIQEGWWIEHIEIQKNDESNKQFLLFKLQKGAY